MSWDVFIFSTDPRHSTNVAKIPPLGDASDLRTKISTSWPGIHRDARAFGTLEGNGWSIQFDYETNGHNDCLMLQIRGGGDPLRAVVKLCKDNGWVALDTATGDLINLTAPSSKSWKGFQAYRDQVVGSSPQQAPKTNFLHDHPEIFLTVSLITIICIVYLIRKR